MATFHGQTVDIYEDFEDASLASGLTENDAGGYLTINSTGRYRGGGHSCAIDMSVSNQAQIQYDLASSGSVSVGFWYYTSNYPSNGSEMIFLDFRGGGVSDKCIALQDQRTWTSTRNIAFTEWSEAGINVSDATWYWITVKWEAGIGGTLRIYDTSHNQVGTDITTLGCGVDYHNDVINTIYVGKNISFTNFSGTINVDEFVIDETNMLWPILPWNNKTVTVRPSGGTYTSLSSAITGELAANPDLTSTGMDGILTIQIEGDWSGDTDLSSTIDITGFTTNTSRYPIIQADTCNRASTSWNNSKYSLVVANSWGMYGLYAGQNDGRIIGLQIKTLHAHSGAVVLSNSHGSLLDSCLLANCYAGDLAALIINGGGSAALSTVRNCVIANISTLDGANTGGGIYNSGTTNLTIDNCTVVNCADVGISINAASTTVTNCYSGGNTGADYAGSVGTLTTCYSEDGTRSTTTVPYSISTFTNVTDGSENVSLISSSGLIDIGTDLHARGSWPFNTDIRGISRFNGKWDIGAYEYTATFHGQIVNVYENFEDSTLATGLTENDTNSDLTISDSGQHHDGSAAMSIDLVSVTGYSNIAYDGSGFNDVSVGFWYRTASGFGNFSGYSTIFGIRGGLGDWQIIIGEGKDAGSNDRQFNLRIVGTTIVYQACTDATWYWITIKYTRAGTCYINLYDVNGTYLNGVTGPATGNQTPTDIYLGSNASFANIPATSKSYFDEYVLDYSTATFPLLGWDAGFEQIYSGLGIANISGSASITHTGDKIVTVRPSGGTYTSLQSAITGELAANSDLTAMAGILTIQIEGTWASADSTVTNIAGFTTNSSYYVNIVVDDVSRALGKIDATKYRLEASASFNPALTITNNFTRIKGLQVKNTTASSGNGITITGNSAIIDSCIVHGSPGGYPGIYINGSTGIVIINSLVCDNTGQGIQGQNTFTCWLYNSVFINNGTYGIEVPSWCTFTAKNCYMGGNTSGQLLINANGVWNHTTCASSDGSNVDSTIAFTNSGSAGTRFTSITANAEDIHIASSSLLVGQGTNLTADGTWPFSLDMDGNTRPSVGAWDIGANEITITSIFTVMIRKMIVFS